MFKKNNRTKSCFCPDKYILNNNSIFFANKLILKMVKGNTDVEMKDVSTPTKKEKVEKVNGVADEEPPKDPDLLTLEGFYFSKLGHNLRTIFWRIQLRRTLV